jgi:hypothetical protein
MKQQWWLWILHAVIMGGGIAGSVLVPGAGTAIMAASGTLNALLPSPIASAPGPTEGK